MALALSMDEQMAVARARTSAKKILKGLREEGRSVDEAVAERECRREQAVDELEEASCVEQTQTVQAKQAREELEQLHDDVGGQIKEELAAAVNFRKLREEQNGLHANTYALRLELFEAQQKLSLMEVISANRETMKVIAEKAEAAVKVAEEANMRVVEEKVLQRQSLEATRRAWNGMDKKGSKRTACAADLHELLSKARVLSSAPEAKECAHTMVQSRAPTIVQKRSSMHIAEDSTCTFLDDAQPPSSL